MPEPRRRDLAGLEARAFEPCSKLARACAAPVQAARSDALYWADVKAGPDTTPALADDDLSGTVLGGRYHLVKRLGQGGMGVVYEAVQVDLGRRVAVKLISGEVSPSALSRFRTEALATARLGNPHIVQVTDFRAGGDGEPPFMVMELLAGRTLRALLQAEGVIGWQRALRLGCQMLDALAAAHAEGIIHRDVKPDNVFVVASAAVPDMAKVLDFGIAKLVADHPEMHSRVTTTANGVLVGTLGYVAPELTLGGTAGERSDLYAVAVTLYEAIAGRRPFTTRDPRELLAAVVRTDPPDIRELCPHLPDEVGAVLMRGLSRRARERPPTAAAMAAELARCLGERAEEPAPTARDGGAAEATASVSPTERGDEAALAPTAPASELPGAPSTERLPNARPSTPSTSTRPIVRASSPTPLPARTSEVTALDSSAHTRAQPRPPEVGARASKRWLAAVVASALVVAALVGGVALVEGDRVRIAALRAEPAPPPPPSAPPASTSPPVPPPSHPPPPGEIGVVTVEQLTARLTRAGWKVASPDVTTSPEGRNTFLYVSRLEPDSSASSGYYGNVQLTECVDAEVAARVEARQSENPSDAVAQVGSRVLLVSVKRRTAPFGQSDAEASRALFDALVF